MRRPRKRDHLTIMPVWKLLSDIISTEGQWEGGRGAYSGVPEGKVAVVVAIFELLAGCEMPDARVDCRADT